MKFTKICFPHQMPERITEVGGYHWGGTIDYHINGIPCTERMFFYAQEILNKSLTYRTIKTYGSQRCQEGK